MSKLINIQIQKVVNGKCTVNIVDERKTCKVLSVDATGWISLHDKQLKLGEPFYGNEAFHGTVEVSPCDVLHEPESRSILIPVKYLQSLVHKVA